jgi:DNA-binding NarL/FixJ family response regulator
VGSVKTNKKSTTTNSKTKVCAEQQESFEVAVIEDNKLVNLILSKSLDSTISKIRNLKNCLIKFSNFFYGTDFLTYLENREFGESKLIVFSDYYLEKEMNGAEILKKIKQKGIDATVVIMSDTTNQQTSIDTVSMGALCFLPKDNNTPFVCSQMLSQMVN